MNEALRIIDRHQRHEDRLFEFAKAAMQALIRVENIRQGKETGTRYTLDCKAAWSMAEAMMAEKERRDSEQKTTN